MNGLYIKLAAIGVRKNGKSYIPYIITAAVMTAIFYIMAFLGNNPFLGKKYGGNTMKMILDVGVIVMAVFAAIFLFYTNSSLVKRRKKEFGLYNVLGLKKSQIARVLVWETLIVYALSTVSGLGLGILFSKLAEQLAAKMLRGDISYKFSIDPLAVLLTLVVFAVIFLIIMLNSLGQLFFSRPIELLRDGSKGEKPPSSNIPLAVSGAVMLCGAYIFIAFVNNYSAVVNGIALAIIAIIVSTYLLFISGSVALCRILQKNNNYYYKLRHFVSVSQMKYRMRRNGAGLASICVMSTLVLVVMSSVATMYLNAQWYIDRECPSDIELCVFVKKGMDETDLAEKVAYDVCKQKGITPSNITRSYYAYFSQNMNEALGISGEGTPSTTVYAADVFPEEPVNSLVLSDREIAYCEPFSDFINGSASITFGDTQYTLKKIEQDLNIVSQDTTYHSSMKTPDPKIYLFVKNKDVMQDLLDTVYDPDKHSYGFFGIIRFDVPDELTGDEIVQLSSALRSAGDEITLGENEYEGRSSLSIAPTTRVEFAGGYYGAYGGFLFLGILLGSVFLLAAILTMYYKQISEGYEDAERFETLHKLGMSRSEIKKTINSQVLTVFFLPLIAAGVHMFFASTILSRLFRALDTIVFSPGTYALIAVICYLAFSAVYILVYRATSAGYSRIVNK